MRRPRRFERRKGSLWRKGNAKPPGFAGGSRSARRRPHRSRSAWRRRTGGSRSFRRRRTRRPRRSRKRRRASRDWRRNTRGRRPSRGNGTGTSPTRCRSSTGSATPPWRGCDAPLPAGGNDIRHPKALFYRYSAQGTPLYQLGLRMMPKGPARWVRRAIAPHPPQQGPPPAPAPSQDRRRIARRAGLGAVRRHRLLHHRLGLPLPAAPADRRAVRTPTATGSSFSRRPTSSSGTASPGGFFSQNRRASSELRMRNRRALDVYGGRLERDDLKTLEKGLRVSRPASTESATRSACLEGTVLVSRSRSACGSDFGLAWSTTAWTSGPTSRDSRDRVIFARAGPRLDRGRHRRLGRPAPRRNGRAARRASCWPRNGVDTRALPRALRREPAAGKASPTRSSATTARSRRGWTSRWGSSRSRAATPRRRSCSPAVISTWTSRRWRSFPNVRLLGQRPYEEMPGAPLELRRLHDPVPGQRHHRGDQPGEVLRVPLR